MARDKPLTRRAGFRRPNPLILVVCEGSVTEPRYFEDFTALRRNALVRVQTAGGRGAAISVVEHAIERQLDLKRSARRSRDSFDSEFEVWAVFDRDNQGDQAIAEAIRLAHEHGIEVAFSSPCFEVWGLMHFSCYDRPGHQRHAQLALRERLIGYCHETNPVFDVQQLDGRYDDAVRNAERALQRLEAERARTENPSTTVHKLTERIRAFGRK